MKTTVNAWALNFAAALAMLRTGGGDYRAAHANRGTPPRRHKGNHTMHAQQSARLLRGRFRAAMDAGSVERIAGTNPTPERLADAKRVVYSR